MSVLVDLVNERFEFGWYFPETGEVKLESDPSLGSYFPAAYVDGEPVYAPGSRAAAVPTIVCPRCMEPVWAVTRHCVERHGDGDVTVLPPVPGRTPPDWFSPAWT